MFRRHASTLSTFGAASLVLLGLPRLHAQMHHIEAPEHVTRALGVYEWTGDLPKPTAARFVPVSLFINGHFEEAGEYLARPVPFALESGNLYTVEHAGLPEGVLDLQTAERVVTGRALADDNAAGSWYGFGKFTAEAPAEAPAPLHRSAHVGVIQATAGPNGTGSTPTASAPAEGSDRPHMSRRSDADKGAGDTADAGKDTPASPSKNDRSGSSADTGTDAGKSRSADRSEDDNDRPTLARRDPSQDSARSQMGRGKKAQASVTSAGPAPGEDPDRPVLTHNTQASDAVEPLTGLPANMRQAVAVSDPTLRDPHPFARAWESAAEQTSTTASLAATAKTSVAAYLGKNQLVPVRGTVAPEASSAAGDGSTEGIAANTETGAGAPPKLQRGKPREYGSTVNATPPAASATRTPVKPHAGAKPHASVPRQDGGVPLTLQGEQVVGFTLTFGGLPTFVYTASAPAGPTAGAASDAARPTVFVTVVAQRLPAGDLQVALTNVTDSLHLDRNPRMRLIDAVDPDASHRGSLLFELRGTGSRQFALYRLTSARAQTTFTTASIE